MAVHEEVFGDESGNFDFTPKGTPFFFVCTIVNRHPSLADDMLSLRAELATHGHELHDGFHATYDNLGSVRQEVFALLAARNVRVDATYYTKSQIYKYIAANPDYFYRWAWFYHLRHVLPRVITPGSQPVIALATLGDKKRRRVYASALRSVVKQCCPGSPASVCAYWSAASHPCLQAADYYTWAIKRKVENGDDRWYRMVAHQVATLYHFV